MQSYGGKVWRLPIAFLKGLITLFSELMPFEKCAPTLCWANILTWCAITLPGPKTTTWSSKTNIVMVSSLTFGPNVNGPGPGSMWQIGFLVQGWVRDGLAYRGISSNVLQPKKLRFAFAPWKFIKFLF